MVGTVLNSVYDWLPVSINDTGSVFKKRIMAKKKKHEKTPPKTPVKFTQISAEEIEKKRSKAWKYMF